MLQQDKLSWTCKNCKRRSSIIPGPATATPSPASTHPADPQTPITLAPPSASSRQSGQLPRVKILAPKSNTPTLTVKQLTESLDKQSEKITILEDLLRAAILRIDSLESQLSEKSTQIGSLASKTLNLEAKSNLAQKQLVEDKLEIQGLPSSALENPSASLSAVGIAIGCPLIPEDLKDPPIRISSRLSLSFKSPAKRREFLVAGKSFNKNKDRFIWDNRNHRIHINEELSASQRDLFRETKSFARNNNLKFVWVGLSGQIFLKKDENHIPIVIHSSSVLHDVDILPKLSRPADESRRGAQSTAA